LFCSVPQCLISGLQRLKQFQPEAEKHACGFLRLGQKVTAFKHDLKDKIESENKEVENKLKKIEKRLVKLESALETSVLRASLPHHFG